MVVLQSFSSVVGPNGSGKSNVIDAMLFVFGKRAKQLRLNKVSELIHNSTDFRNLEYARVEVHFHEIVDKEGEDFEAVPDSDFVISREAYRNNTSKYFVDAKASNFTEVTTLLKGLGVDLNNNRFLILQGEVEQISMMKPKAVNPNDEGLLEYLEDIIGTNQYVEHIDAKAKSLEELNEKRGSQVKRLKLVEKERDALQGAKHEAETYMAKERELLKTRSVLYQLFVQEARTNVAKIAASKSELEQKLEHERAKCTEHQASVEGLEVGEEAFFWGGGRRGGEKRRGGARRAAPTRDASPKKKNTQDRHTSTRARTRLLRATVTKNARVQPLFTTRIVTSRVRML